MIRQGEAVELKSGGSLDPSQLVLMWRLWLRWSEYVLMVHSGQVPKVHIFPESTEPEKNLRRTLLGFTAVNSFAIVLYILDAYTAIGGESGNG